MIGICIGNSVGRRNGISWISSTYILRSGATWYKRERNAALGYFKLWYSSDSGANWEELLTLDLTEDNVLIDTPHLYTHRIVGTAYQVVSGGEILYTT